jgi:adenylate kinase
MNLSVRTSRVSRLRVVHAAPIEERTLNIVLFGPPGAGKGTQADRFAARHHVPKISTGDMLRKAIADHTALGALVQGTLQHGTLVSDEVMITLVGQRLAEPDAVMGFVLDGFPRTIPQAAALDGLLADRGRPIVIALAVHTDEVVRRLSRRGREDDDEWVLRERLAIYSRDTEPVLEYYRRRGLVTVLDGNRPADEVTDAIESVLAKHRTNARSAS